MDTSVQACVGLSSRLIQIGARVHLDGYQGTGLSRLVQVFIQTDTRHSPVQAGARVRLDTKILVRLDTRV